MGSSDGRLERRLAHYTPERVRAAAGFEDVTDAVAQAFVDRSRGLGDSPVAVFAPRGREGDIHQNRSEDL